MLAKKLTAAFVLDLRTLLRVAVNASRALATGGAAALASTPAFYLLLGIALLMVGGGLFLARRRGGLA